MTKSPRSYEHLSDKDKQQVISIHYTDKKQSFSDIAEEYGTYANKIRRDAIRFKISIRDKSAAQKNALTTGKHKHPTKGTQRDESVKSKIGVSVLKSWENLSQDDLEKRKIKSRDQWQNMEEDVKANMLQSANNAVRATSKTGSKLEKYLFKRLLEDGYSVDFHKEQGLLNTKLQIDLFVASINTAIEIDGPSHFLPVWGDTALQRNIKYDNKKQGLILGKGWILIRVKQTKDFSKTRSELLYQKLKQVVEEIAQASSNKKQNKSTSYQIED